MYNNNTYGFNPYMNQQRFQNQPLNQQPIQQTLPQIPQVCSLMGKQVDSIDVVKATDIPLDGSTCYFPLIDGSAIVTKKLQNDGTSKTIIYKPVDNQEETKIKLSKALKHRPSWNRIKQKQDIINIVLKYKELKCYRKVDRYFGFANGTTGNIIRGKIYFDYQNLIKDMLNT